MCNAGRWASEEQRELQGKEKTVLSLRLAAEFLPEQDMM